MLSDMRPFRILHRIQLATTRKIFVTTSADVTRAAGTDDNENHVPLVAREKIEVYESRSLWRILTTSAKQVKTLLSDAH
jgi:hypothetical protein